MNGMNGSGDSGNSGNDSGGSGGSGNGNGFSNNSNNNATMNMAVYDTGVGRRHGPNNQWVVASRRYIQRDDGTGSNTSGYTITEDVFVPQQLLASIEQDEASGVKYN